MRSLLTVSLGPMLLARDLEVTSTTWRHFRDRFSFCDSRGSGNPLKYSCLGNPIDRGACWATDRGVTRVRHN